MSATVCGSQENGAQEFGKLKIPSQTLSQGLQFLSFFLHLLFAQERSLHKCS